MISGNATLGGDSLPAVSEEVARCTRCPLYRTRNKTVPGEGPPNAKVFIIGEGPGRNEDAQGRPFVGAAGKQLGLLLGYAGLSREDVFITNLVKCRPPENRQPTDPEAQACRPYLERQLTLVAPRVVVLLGDSALKRFIPDGRLTSSHGKIFKRGGLAFFSTYHPAAIIYDRSLEETIKKDFEGLANVLKDPS